MTALKQYQRLEATGLWRATPEDQRRDVIVSIGDATLIITDTHDRVLAHWSLPALQRTNPGEIPAIYQPDGDPGETLEFPEDEDHFISEIERLRAAIHRHRPRPGRLRLVTLATVVLAVLALGVFWLPNALISHTVSVVPEVKREEIGKALLAHVRRVTGAPCTTPAANLALRRLSARLPAPGGQVDRLVVMREGVRDTVQLPGRIMLLSRTLVEDHEDPDVVAGYILAEQLRAERRDPLARLLRYGGVSDSFKLLTTGRLSTETLRGYAEARLTQPTPRVDDAALLGAFDAQEVRSSPYAYALDITGEKTLPLIEADPYANSTSRPVLSDGDWIRLQGICGG
ncbi:MAG: hypothetical protein FH759_14040 [Sediminimonas qiaohouensis]|uniref:Uncharacterized protein n=1 Tax=Sediminimonas qiaohouensis TaxID=552061 RepID=A0A7C9LC69_9RHOB|nr:hypothetical protein [Sediminimonas qiaohouensis]MTJ05797.1 hypothetical protein [Sediminimonas qiaohouensis]